MSDKHSSYFLKEYNSTLGVIILIEDVERGKKDIREHLVSARQNPVERAHELVELLESEADLSREFPNREISKKHKSVTKEYNAFCKAYIIYLFNNIIVDDEDTEIMLVAFNYLSAYEHEKRAVQRRELYIREVYAPRHPERNWTKAKIRNFYDIEARIIDELSELLVKLAIKQGGTLKLVEEVLATLEPLNTVENDDTIPEDIDEDTASPLEDGPPITEDRQGSRSNQTSQANTPDSPPNPQRTHTWQFSIGSIININKKSQVNANLSWVKNPIFSIVVIIVAVMACMKLFHPPAPPTEGVSSAPTIVVVNGDILLTPNSLFGLNAAVLPVEDADAILRYVSSDPDVVAVGEHNGMLQAPASHSAGGVQTADITITDESGATTTKTVAVDFDLPGNTSNSGPGHNIQLDDFVPDFSVTQKIRIAGDTEWHNYVDAKVGDELEIQFEYRNTSEEEHVNVAVKDILPANLEYVAGSTTLYTVKTPEGAPRDQDGLVENGIYIGTYGSGSNAYIRFRVRVVDTNLADGVTGLVNWSQACVNGVTLQDFATVRVTKE